MSLSWLDRLTLFVHPQRVVLERKPWRGPVVYQRTDVALPQGGEADWQAALVAVEGLLGAVPRGAILRIVIADPFVRYAVLPWSDRLLGASARLLMARALFRSTLGERADSLAIALDRPAFGQSGIAAGIDDKLLAALRGLAKSRRLRLHSLQPRFIAELKDRHQQLGEGWFACIDEGWLTLAGIRAGQIVSLRNHRAHTADRQMLAADLAGMLAADAVSPTDRKLFVSSRVAALPALPGHWETTHWASILGGEAHA